MKRSMLVALVVLTVSAFAGTLMAQEVEKPAAKEKTSEVTKKTTGKRMTHKKTVAMKTSSKKKSGKKASAKKPEEKKEPEYK